MSHKSSKMLDKSIFFKTVIFIIFIWVIYLADQLCLFNREGFSINRENGVLSIFSGVFIHGSLRHILSNTQGVLITFPLLFYLHRKRASEIILAGLFFPSFFVFFLGLNVVGISGLLYCLVWFLIFSGIGSKSKERFLVSIIMILFYSSTLSGVTVEAGYNISWQAHLFGFLTGSGYSIEKYFKR